MKTQLVVTDLTRMWGKNVCVAGYSTERVGVRPVLQRPGISEDSIVLGGKPIVFPFARIQLDLDPTDSTPPKAPHVEDVRFKPDSLELMGKEPDPEAVLNWSLFPDIKVMFDGGVRRGPGFYVLDGKGPRSLGTVRPTKVEGIPYGPSGEGEPWGYRLHFYDGDKDRTFYKLKITDLTWNLYCNARIEKGQHREDIASDLKGMLNSRKVYLRIGLARGDWRKFPDRCYLQVNGIHTFPDYLDGKLFTDFYPQA